MHSPSDLRNTKVLFASNQLGEPARLQLAAAGLPYNGIAANLQTMVEGLYQPSMYWEVGQSNVVEFTPYRTLPANEPIPYGSAATYTVSFSFQNVAERTAEADPVGSIAEQMRATAPQTLSWNDRRPIGFITLANHGKSTRFNPLNPRYWWFVNLRLMSPIPLTIAITQRNCLTPLLRW